MDNVEWWEAEGNPWSPGRAFVGVQEAVDGVFGRIAAETEGFGKITRFQQFVDTRQLVDVLGA